MKDAPKISELTISRTQILDFQSCEYRWDLSYKRGITTAAVRAAMDLGSVVHRGMKGAIARYVKTGKTAKTSQFVAISGEVREWEKEERKKRGDLLTIEMETQLETLRDEAIVIAGRALDNFDLNEWEVAKLDGKPVFEREFLHPLAPWKGYRTIPDLIARPKRHQKGEGWWLIDWKCRSSFEEQEAEEINLQFSSMQHVLAPRRKELLIEGSILWQVKSSVPTWPKQNKDGSMSRAKIATDWPTYERALLEAKLNPADYRAEMEPKLDTVWFSTIRQHRSYAECEAIWQQIVAPMGKRIAAHIINDDVSIRRFTHMFGACSWCWARQFCLTELRDEDVEWLLETDYLDTRNPRKRREMGDGTTFKMI